MGCAFSQRNNRVIFSREPINDVRYLGILEEFVGIHTALENHSKASWFMQDGARPHQTSAVFNFLKEYFRERVIALAYDRHIRSGVEWSLNSQDLTPCDFFLCRYLKDLVFRQIPQTIVKLKQHICTACETIPSDMFERMSRHFCLRLDHVVAANGVYLENAIVYFLQPSLQNFYTGFYFL